jgi:hypothetical protein
VRSRVVHVLSVITFYVCVWGVLYFTYVGRSVASRSYVVVVSPLRNGSVLRVMLIVTTSTREPKNQCKYKPTPVSSHNF